MTEITPEDIGYINFESKRNMPAIPSVKSTFDISAFDDGGDPWPGLIEVDYVSFDWNSGEYAIGLSGDGLDIFVSDLEKYAKMMTDIGFSETERIFSKSEVQT